MSDQDGANNNAHNCTRSRPCNRWRACHFCAKRRQARIADAVEKLHGLAGTLSWHILYPHAIGQDALRAVRADWLKLSMPESSIWTVEQSRKTDRLHLNIITPAAAVPAAVAAEQWRREITGNVRHVGAYIGKRDQAPKQTDFAGRTFGTSGQLWHILATQKQYPAVAAAAAQYAIDSHAMIEHAAYLLLSDSEKNRRKWAAEAAAEAEKTRPDRDQARQIAARWLPDILAAQRLRPDSRFAPHPIPNPSPSGKGLKP